MNNPRETLTGKKTHSRERIVRWERKRDSERKVNYVSFSFPLLISFL